LIFVYIVHVIKPEKSPSPNCFFFWLQRKRYFRSLESCVACHFRNSYIIGW